MPGLVCSKGVPKAEGDVVGSVLLLPPHDARLGGISSRNSSIEGEERDEKGGQRKEALCLRDLPFSRAQLEFASTQHHSRHSTPLHFYFCLSSPFPPTR